MLSRIQAFPTLRFVVKMEPPLIRLCMNGDVAGVREAIEGGADVNIGSKTPLMWALWNHQNAVVDMLTEMDEVDVNCKDYNGATALHHAVDVDNDHGALVLLAQPRLLDVNHKNNKGLSALMLAVSRNKVKCATLLLDDPRVDLNTRDNFKRAPEDIEREVKVEQWPVSKVLLDGLYDPESNLSQLRGCQHIMKLIWEEVLEDIRRTVSKLGRSLDEVVANTPSLWGTGLADLIKEARERRMSQNS